jgi:hypothetical protein
VVVRRKVTTVETSGEGRGRGGWCEAVVRAPSLCQKVVAALRIDIRVVGGGDDGRTPTTSGFGRLRRGVMVRLRVGGSGGVTSVTSDGWTVDRIKEDKAEVGEEEKVMGSPQR